MIQEYYDQKDSQYFQQDQLKRKVIKSLKANIKFKQLKITVQKIADEKRNEWLMEKALKSLFQYAQCQQDHRQALVQLFNKNLLTIQRAAFCSLRIYLEKQKQKEIDKKTLLQIVNYKLMQRSFMTLLGYQAFRKDLTLRADLIRSQIQTNLIKNCFQNLHNFSSNKRRLGMIFQQVKGQQDYKNLFRFFKYWQVKYQNYQRNEGIVRRKQQKGRTEQFFQLWRQVMFTQREQKFVLNTFTEELNYKKMKVYFDEFKNILQHEIINSKKIRQIKSKLFNRTLVICFEALQINLQFQKKWKKVCKISNQSQKKKIFISFKYMIQLKKQFNFLSQKENKKFLNIYFQAFSQFVKQKKARNYIGDKIKIKNKRNIQKQVIFEIRKIIQEKDQFRNLYLQMIFKRWVQSFQNRKNLNKVSKVISGSNQKRTIQFFFNLWQAEQQNSFLEKKVIMPHILKRNHKYKLEIFETLAQYSNYKKEQKMKKSLSTNSFTLQLKMKSFIQLKNYSNKQIQRKNQILLMQIYSKRMNLQKIFESFKIFTVQQNDLKKKQFTIQSKVHQKLRCDFFQVWYQKFQIKNQNQIHEKNQLDCDLKQKCFFELVQYCKKRKMNKERLEEGRIYYRTQLSKKVIDSLAWYTFDYRKIKDEHKYDADLFFTVQIFRKWFNLVITKQSFYQQQAYDDSSQQINQSQFTDSSKPPLVTQSQIMSSQVNYDSVPQQKMNNLPLKKGQVSQSLNVDSYRHQIQPEQQSIQKQRRSQDMPLQFQENDFLNSLQSLEEMRLAHEEIAARINSLIALQQEFVNDIEKRQEISTELQQLQALGSLLKQKYNTNNTSDSSLQQAQLFYNMTLFNKVINSFRKFAQIENIIVYKFAAKQDSRILKQAFTALNTNYQQIANENYRKRILRKGLFGLKKYQLMLMLMRTVRAGQEDRIIADVFMSWRQVFIERQIQNERNHMNRPDLDILLQVSDDFVSASRQNMQKQRVLSLDKFSSSKSARRYLVSDQEDYNNVGSHLISEQIDESMTSDISSDIKLSSLANEMNFDKIMNIKAKNNNFDYKDDGNSLLCDILNNLKDCSEHKEQQYDKDDEQSEAKEIQNFELSHQTLSGLELQSSPLEDSSLMLAFSDDKNAILDSQRGHLDSQRSQGDAKLILQEVKQFSETATFEGRLAQMMLTPVDVKEKQHIDSSRTNILKNKLDVSPMNDPEPYAGFGEDTDEQEQKNDISCESLSIPN